MGVCLWAGLGKRVREHVRYGIVLWACIQMCLCGCIIVGVCICASENLWKCMFVRVCTRVCDIRESLSRND